MTGGYGRSTLALFLVLGTLSSTKARADDATATINLDNLVPYTHPVAAWSDRHSNITLSWKKPSEIGLQRLCSLVGWHGTEITRQLLSWQLSENGQKLPLSLKSRNFRPDKIVEIDTADGLDLRAVVSFPVRNGLAVEFTLTNQTAKPRIVEIDFDFPGKGIAPDWKGPFPIGKCVSIDGEPTGSWSTLYVHNAHGIEQLWVSGFVAGMPQGTPLELVCLTDLAPRTLKLGPQEKTRVVIPMAFGRYRGLARDVLAACRKKIANQWTPAEESLRWREVFRRAPGLPKKYRDRQDYQRMYAHAMAALSSLCLRGEGGYVGHKRVPYVAKYDLAIAFFWDTSFSAVGLREFDASLAHEAILCFTENPGPRGSLPGTLSDTHRAGEGQAPIMSWAAWLVYQRSHDKAWLRRIYPALADNARFWFKYHSTPRGLCQFFNAGQIADNDARFDAIQGKRINQPLSGFESPDINAFLVMDTRCLGQMAKELGLAEEATAWQVKSESLAKRIVETMYFSEDAVFHDVKTGTHEKFSNVLTPNMFLPLWAGVPLAKDQAKAVVERHMLNPNEFYRTLPFPSLSFNDPKYHPRGYWRGRIWPHVAYWMVQILWHSGYHAQAEETADRLLEMLSKGPYLNENYQSATGEGTGCPDYNWTCAAAIELLLERYKEPMP
mgnify:CR=1 FL=1